MFAPFCSYLERCNEDREVQRLDLSAVLGTAAAVRMAFSLSRTCLTRQSALRFTDFAAVGTWLLQRKSLHAQPEYEGFLEFLAARSSFVDVEVSSCTLILSGAGCVKVLSPSICSSPGMQSLHSKLVRLFLEDLCPSRCFVIFCNCLCLFCLILFVFCDFKMRRLFGFCARQSLVRATDPAITA